MTVSSAKLKAEIKDTREQLQRVETVVGGSGVGGLPEGWIEVKLENISSDISYGYTAKSTQLNVGPHLLRITDIQDGDVNWSSVPFCEIDSNKEEKYLIEKGDLLFARTGATVGKSFLVRIDPPKSVYASYLIRVRTLDKSGTEYLAHFFNSPAYWNQITELSAGIGQPNVNGSKLKALQIPLPPLEEQTVIAQALDTLLAQVDSIKTRLDAMPKILKTFRQSVLAAAVSGKLTEEWRGDNEYGSAAELLKKFKIARSEIFINEIEGGNKETKKLFGKISKHVFSKPIEFIPEDWVWTSFMDSMERVVDCHNKTAPYIEKGIPLIRTPDIRDGKISLKGARYISEETYDYWSRRCPPEAGDIVLTREAPMGEAGIVPVGVKLCMGQRMMLLRPLPEYVNPSYVLLNILSLNFQIRMHKKAIGTGVKHLRVSDVESLTYPMCSLKEQSEIVRRVEELFAFADQIEQQVKNAQGRVNNLTQSILAKAFRGELSTQWRAENPELISGENSAEALLEKINIEREILTKQAKPKRNTVKKKMGSSMTQKIIKVVEALKQAGEPLNGQQLLAAAGYPSDSDTAELEKFFLDIRGALTNEKSIIKLKRSDDSQDWFTLAEAKKKS